MTDFNLALYLEKIEDIRSDFPALSKIVHETPLVYLDNAATTHKPQSVIDAISQFYASEYGTVHRGVYAMSVESTSKYNTVRSQLASFINSPSSDCIIFTRGCTEAINLVANSYGRPFINDGDEILISEIEHHANYVPWQKLAQENNAILRTIPISDAGDLDMTVFEDLLSEKTALVAVAHVSNVLGTIHPVDKIIQLAHNVGAKVLIDGAQAAPHFKVDVQALDCDFYCFSAHKLYGPTGVGCLYAKYELLDKMEPYQLGGDMIETVTFEKTDFAKPPLKFEAGTPAIAQVIGFGAALSYLESIGLDNIEAYETYLLEYATNALEKLSFVTLIGTSKTKASVISFIMDVAHPHDIGSILDMDGVAVRAGHHCSQPTMSRYNVPATSRVSFSFYNTTEEIDIFIKSLHKVKELLG